MSWLPPDAWLDACGAAADGLRTPYVSRQGEDVLWETLGLDPRRAALLVGEPGTGTSRMALELARRAVTAFYPDPLPPPNAARRAAELTARLRDVPSAQRPLVVLDGPNRSEAFALAQPLLHEPIHPRLLVLIPATVDEARRLLHGADRYPYANALVATIDVAAGSARPELAGLPRDALLPFALAGRRRTIAGCGGDDHALLHERWLLAEHRPSGTTLCLLSDRARRTLVEDELVLAADGPARLARILADDPSLRPHATATLLRWSDEPRQLDFHDVLFGAPVMELLETLDHLDLAPPISPRLAQHLRARLAALLEAESDPQTAARLEEQLAHVAFAEWDTDSGARWLRAALQRQLPSMRERLAEQLAQASVDAASYDQVAADYRARNDLAGLARALRAAARLHSLAERLDEAAARCAEWLAVEEAGDSFVGAVAARTLAVEIEAQRGNVDAAIAHAERVLVDRRRIGDVQGQLLILHRLSTLRQTLAGSRAALNEALELEHAVGNPLGEATCLVALGEVAARRGERSTAASHYAAALTICEAHQMPGLDGLRAALDCARGRFSAERSPPATSPLVPLSLRKSPP